MFSLPTRRLPREELKRFVRTTPFSSWEVRRLWKRFARLDVDNSGFLLLQVCCCCCGVCFCGMLGGNAAVHAAA
jgi:hypothetical protein